MPDEEQARDVFRSIPRVYDRMNTLMSMGMDVFWRLKLLSLCPSEGLILDIGTGTGKLESLDGFQRKFIGLDVTREMIELNRNKGHTVLGSATSLPFKGAKFDGVISAFVLRNLPSTERYFSEAFNVLRSGGIIASLDAFPERRRIISEFFSVYFYRFIPWIMKATRYGESYEYLSRSVKDFKTPERIAEEMLQAGFSDVRIKKFFSPSAAIVYGRKA
ncbi:MAG: class I SAM-dependent methyltransferase [Thermoplasmata archaeon]